MNKFIVNSKIILLALQFVSKVIEKRPAVPIIENFLFSVANQVLTISGTDLYNTLKLSLRIECEKSLKFCAVVPAEIIKYLQKLDEQPLKIEWDSENYSVIIAEVSVQDGENFLKDVARAKYSGENPADFPIAPQTNIQLFETSSDLFKEFKDLLNYVSADQLRPAMTGIGFIEYFGAFTMIATDGHRLKTVAVPELSGPSIWTDLCFKTWRKETEDKIERYSRMDLPIADKYAARLQTDLYNVERENIKQNFILPAKAAKILSDLKFGTAKEPITESVIVCADEKKDAISFLFSYLSFDVELTVRNIDERYPQYWNVIPETTLTRYTVDKKAFLKVVDKAALFANKTTHQVRLSLNGKNKVSAEDLDFSNEYCADAGGSYEGEPIEIGFNASMLKEVANSFGDTITLEMREANKAITIREGNSLALLMPVMLNQYV